MPGPRLIMSKTSLHVYHIAVTLGFLIIWGSLGPNWRASLVAQWYRILPPIQDTQVRSRGQEDALEKGMAIHSSILAWEIPWTEGPGRL